MTVLYSNRIKKKICDDYHISKNFDSNIGKAIKFVLSLLQNSNCLDDIPNVPPTRRHKLTDGRYAIDVSKNYRMIIVSNVFTNDLKLIDSITIDEICDYH